MHREKKKVAYCLTAIWTMYRLQGIEVINTTYHFVFKVTYFVEAYCKRYRPYICYKKYKNVTTEIPTFCGIEGYDWQIYFNKRNWFEAYSICEAKYNSGKLAIVKNHLVRPVLFMMGEFTSCK